jgi:hypothetical protein
LIEDYRDWLDPQKNFKSVLLSFEIREITSVSNVLVKNGPLQKEVLELTQKFENGEMTDKIRQSIANLTDKPGDIDPEKFYADETSWKDSGSIKGQAESTKPAGTWPPAKPSGKM